jgi:pathogenesis-related protein 1
MAPIPRSTLLLLALGLSPAGVSAAQPVDPGPMLQAHNAVRAQHGLPPLAWSERLARDAASWVDQLAESESCRMVHSDAAQGENLYWASPVRWSDGRTTVQSVSPAEVVRQWAAEQADYDYARNRCRAEACGHYTQIVWRETDAVGCAMRVCEDKAQLWACRYHPPGNIVGRRPY